MADIEQHHKMGMRYVVLSGEDFGADRQKAKHILRHIRAWNRTKRKKMSFAVQCTPDVSEDEEFLELAAESGLTRISLGLETPNPASLKEARKYHNLVHDMGRVVRNLHEHGIMVSSGCVVGFDHDDLSIFQTSFDFFAEIGVATVMVLPLQAQEGTPLKERMIREGRYLPYVKVTPDGLEPVTGDGRHTVLNTFTVQPKKMTVAQLQQGTWWLLWKLYDLDAFVKRLKVFYDQYEGSPKRGKLKFPKGPPDREALGILARVLKYNLREASWEEKWPFFSLLDIARRSSHPQAMPLAIASYLIAKNAHEMLLKHDPDVSRVKYPVAASEGVLAGHASIGRD